MNDFAARHLLRDRDAAAYLFRQLGMNVHRCVYRSAAGCPLTR
jgi:hypothetical protein